MEKLGHSVTESQTLGHVVTLSRSHAVMEKPGHSVTILPEATYEKNRYETVRRPKEAKFVTYVFLGSKTHTLKRMFTDAARPFYESSAVLCMGKPPMAESVQFIKDRFVSCGLTCPDEVAGCILRESRNIPY